jgi:hypothetical protein
MAAKKRSKKENPSNKMYSSTKRWITNKAKKLSKHLAKHPNDLQSKEQRSTSYGRSIPIDLAKKVLADRRWNQYIKGSL